MCGSDQEDREESPKEVWREVQSDGMSFKAADGESEKGAMVWK